MRGVSVQSASATIGLITGLGTVIAWVVQGASSLDALGSLLWKTVLGTLLVLVGMFYFGQAFGWMLDRILPGEAAFDDESWTPFAIGIPCAGTAVGIWTDSKAFTDLYGSIGFATLPLTLFGGAALAFLLIFGVEMARGERAASGKTCPDCANTVLAAARKCQFCGYRFAPPPS